MIYFFSAYFWKDSIVCAAFLIIFCTGIYEVFLQPQLSKNALLKHQYQEVFEKENAAILMMKTDLDNQAALDDLTTLFPFLYSNVEQLTSANKIYDVVTSIFKNANLVIVHFSQKTDEKKLFFHVVLHGTYENFYAMFLSLRSYAWPIKIEAFSIEKKGELDMRLQIQGF